MPRMRVDQYHQIVRASRVRTEQGDLRERKAQISSAGGAAKSSFLILSRDGTSRSKNVSVISLSSGVPPHRPSSIPRQYDLRRSLFAPESSYPRPLQRPYPSGLIEQTRSAVPGFGVRGVSYNRAPGSDGRRRKSISIGPTRSTIQRAWVGTKPRGPQNRGPRYGCFVPVGRSWTDCR